MLRRVKKCFQWKYAYAALNLYLLLFILNRIISSLPVWGPKRYQCPQGSKDPRLEFQRTIATGETCGGLGNQMYRFASLYGIGRKLERSPVYIHSDECVYDLQRDVKDIFPAFHSMIHYRHSSLFTRVKFGEICCSYEDPTRLASESAENLLISGYNLQSYEFFHKHRAEIRSIFACSEDIRAKNLAYYDEIFKQGSLRAVDDSLKFCVHVRRGDFVGLGRSSDANYIKRATKKALGRMEVDTANASVLLIGFDKPYMRQIRFDSQMIKAVHILKELPAAEEMCFAIAHCDALLISAPTSTYGFWIAYLMEERRPIFYNPHFSSEGHTYGRKNFLPEWIAIDG